MRRRIVAGNWKLHGTRDFATSLVAGIADHVPVPGVEVVVLPPLPYLGDLIEDFEGRDLAFGAQDVSHNEKGAYTGEVSAAMLIDVGARYGLCGHSERRQYHHEDDALVNAKATSALGQGLVPIICVGEGLDVRKAGDQVTYTLAQLDGALQGIAADQAATVVIAYEPVWAIGTGVVATPDDAQEVCAAIRDRVREVHGDAAADGLRVLYGGSVKAANVGGIMVKTDVDGCLVGGASLQVDEFGGICRFYDMPVL